nr:MAG TPA: Lsm interaction motif [Caudoviricetes sp.]DAZ38082.1 MAG TPA: Lsm interaction motif [Caudoviricetes sp.]
MGVSESLQGKPLKTGAPSNADFRRIEHGG